MVTALTLRTFSTALSELTTPAALLHRAVATRSPFHLPGPDVIVNVALTLSPGATGLNDELMTAADFHVGGTAIFKSSPVTVAPVVLVNVTVVPCEDPGAKVCRPGAFAASAGLTL